MDFYSSSIGFPQLSEISDDSDSPNSLILIGSGKGQITQIDSSRRYCQMQSDRFMNSRSRAEADTTVFRSRSSKRQDLFDCASNLLIGYNKLLEAAARSPPLSSYSDVNNDLVLNFLIWLAIYLISNNFLKRNSIQKFLDEQAEWVSMVNPPVQGTLTNTYKYMVKNLNEILFWEQHVSMAASGILPSPNKEKPNVVFSISTCSS